MKNNIATLSTLAAICWSACGTVLAADWTVSGFVRQEAAYKTTNDQNMNNQQTNAFNGVATAPSGGLLGAPAARPAALTQKNEFNQFSTRLELNLDGKLSETWSAHVKLRGIFDEIGQVEKSFKGRNLYRQEFYSSPHGTPLEAAGKDWMADLPAAYLDFNNGPLWLRLGNQQIAWGEALFFRVSDLPNGLDLRRHSVLGVAAEEYSDTRVPALGLRGSYRLNENWDLEGFAQQFQPTILPGPDSPYNVIASQFTVHEKEGFESVKNNLNLGLRLRGKFGDYGVQAYAVSRNNPDGVYKWTDVTGAGAIPGTAFQAGTTTGVHSAGEWMHSAARMRLDGLGGLMTALNEFPVGAAVAASSFGAACGTPSGAASPIVVNKASANCFLDTFFGAFGNLRGHIVREYPRESVAGFGVNHVFEGEPDTLLDQLIGRFEMSYTSGKKFTNPTLSQQYLRHNETQFAFIAEKYHKFSSEIPATYIVAQWLHKSASDLFGRALEGLDNTPGAVPKGQRGFNAVAFAIQQPSPTLAWRFDMTALTDLKGGWLLQPGTRWKPNRHFQLDIYANILKSSAKQENRNFAQGLEYANELFVRGSYAF
jgi:hypothetical protein